MSANITIPKNIVDDNRIEIEHTAGGPITIKISGLNDPFFGGEFVLSKGQTLSIVHNGAAIQQYLDSSPVIKPAATVYRKEKK